MGGVIASLIVDVAANTVKLQTSVQQIQGQLDKIADMGKKVGAALGISFSVASVVNFAKEIFRAADELTRLSDKTGIGTEGLQRLQAVAEESGNTMDQLTRAISAIQQRLAGGDKSVVAAFAELHLNIAELLKLNPDEQFIQIAKAIAAVEDPTRRSFLAMQVGGKSMVELLPTIRADIDKIAASATIMASSTVKALDDAGDAWGRLWHIIKVGGAEATVWLMKAVELALQLRGARIDVGQPSAPGGPGGLLPAPLGMPSIDTDLEEKLLKRRVDTRLELLKKGAEEEQRLLASNSQLYEDAILNEIVLLDQLRLASIQAHVDPIRQAQVMLQAGIGVKELEQSFMKLVEVPATLAPKSGGFLGKIAQTFSWDSFKTNFSSGMSHAIGGAINSVIGMAQQQGGILGAMGTGAQMGMMFGPWGAAIGAGIGAAVGGISKLLGTEEKKVNDMRDKFQQMNFGSLAAMDEAFRKVGLRVDTVLNAKKVKDFDKAVEEFNKRLEFQKQSFERLQQAIDRYGFTIEELGPALARQKLDEQAQQIYEDFMLLVGAGLSVETVTAKMADAVNKMLANYLTLGIEVPPALRPILQQMIDMGLLLDQNGDLITDISQIPFAETMSEGFNRVVDAINRMVDSIQMFLGITNDAADAVRNFPTFPDTQVPGIPPPGGPDVQQPSDSQSYANGLTIVLNNPSFDTPAGRSTSLAQISRAAMDAQRRMGRVA